MEEIARFIIENKTITVSLKQMRSGLRKELNKLLKATKEKKLIHRQANSDVGNKLYTKSEATRTRIQDLLIANAKRVQEALRVLEEFSKLVDSKMGKTYKITV